jgi:hypothetical protein
MNGSITPVMPENVQSENEPAPPQPAALAGPVMLNACRAARIGEVTDFAQCLVEAASACPHRFVVSSFYYCVHPQREAIIGRTLSAGADRPDATGLEGC